MTLNVQSGGVQPVAPQLLEAYEDLDGPMRFSAGTSGRVRVRGMVADTGSPVLIWEGAQGSPAVVPLSNNARAWRATAGGAVTIGKGGSTFSIPLAISGALDLRPFRERYRYAALIWRDVLTGGARVQVALNNANLGISLSDFLTIWGVEVTSDPAVFGGNWFVRKRLVDSGTITTYADSGLSPLVPRRLVFDYLTGGGLERVLRVRIDGVQVYAESGDVALGFQYPGAGGLEFGFNWGISPGVGSVTFLRDLMYRWEVLSDPWGTL